LGVLKKSNRFLPIALPYQIDGEYTLARHLM